MTQRQIQEIKAFIKTIPLIGPLLQRAMAWLRKMLFPGSTAYWESRYVAGGTSGAGSRGVLAEFKAEIINAFVKDQSINSVIEFGCGDGYQLSLAVYPAYIGLDVSESALEMCRNRFAQDKTKSFFLYEPDAFTEGDSAFRADLALSLDVIYHLIEDSVFEHYMRHLFGAAERFVIVYSSNVERPGKLPHVKHRQFSEWVEKNRPDWNLKERITNKFSPADDSDIGSFAEFFIYEKC